MQKRSIALSAALILAFLAPAIAATTLSNADIGSALKQALTLGTQKVTSALGQKDGFNTNPKVHIPLPPTLQKVDKALTYVGMSHLTDDLELRLNRAAEASMPRAKELFISSIKQMTIQDAKTILNGPNDAATQYLKKTMSPELSKDMQPIIQKALSDSGGIKSYDQVMGQYSQLPLVSSAKTNLNQYVINKTIDGVFYYVAQEEAAIRANPAKQTTSLLKTVFSSLK